MKIAYFDCFAGASGDMILGSLLDAGLDIAELKSEIAKLGLRGYEIGVEKVVKRGISGSQALVMIDDAGQAHPGSHGGAPHHGSDHHHHQNDPPRTHGPAGGEHHHHRNLDDIKDIIEKSALSDSVKLKSIAVFSSLAEAEGKIHGQPVSSVHFHEVGAMDAIIDIVGGVAGLALLGIDAVYCSPLHVGGGTVDCAHGRLPVPAPATLELVKGLPVYANEISGELLTPTGAAILTTLSKHFGPLPAMVVEAVGYGAGQRETTTANLLRVIIGQAA